MPFLYYLFTFCMISNCKNSWTYYFTISLSSDRSNYKSEYKLPDQTDFTKSYLSYWLVHFEHESTLISIFLFGSFHRVMPIWMHTLVSKLIFTNKIQNPTSNAEHGYVSAETQNGTLNGKYPGLLLFGHTWSQASGKCWSGIPKMFGEHVFVCHSTQCWTH